MTTSIKETREAKRLKGKRIAKYAAQVKQHGQIEFQQFTMREIELLERVKSSNK